MKGTVTISLEDYEKLVESTTKYNSLKNSTAYSLKELQVFLSFLCTRENIEKHIEEFNRQSKKSRIVIKDRKALIENKNAENKI